MKNSFKSQLIQGTKVIILALVLGVGANYLFADWSAPTSAPTGGNVAAPLNVGTTDQVKNAGLSLNKLLITGGSVFQGPIQITNGTPANGDILTSDASGNATWQVSAANPAYSFSYIPGSSGYNYTIVCRMNTSNGATTCMNDYAGSSAGGGNYSNPWVSIASPFSATTTGTYTLECVAGSANYNYTSCCRVNMGTGTMECEYNTNLQSSSWQSQASPF